MLLKYSRAETQDDRHGHIIILYRHSLCYADGVVRPAAQRSTRANNLRIMIIGRNDPRSKTLRCLSSLRGAPAGSVTYIPT